VWCGRRPGAAALTLDHVIPRSQGGCNLHHNLITACGVCNSRRKHEPAADFAQRFGWGAEVIALQILRALAAPLPRFLP